MFFNLTLVRDDVGYTYFDWRVARILRLLNHFGAKILRVKALAHYKDFHKDFSKKIVVKIVAHI